MFSSLPGVFRQGTHQLREDKRFYSAKGVKGNKKKGILNKNQSKGIVGYSKGIKE
jgi:hypothetical protein